MTARTTSCGNPGHAGPAPLRRIAPRRQATARVVDPWDCFGVAQVFAYANEIAALAPASRAG